jgi:hypothetical protein
MAGSSSRSCLELCVVVMMLEDASQEVVGSEGRSSFAVLAPCYGRVNCWTNNLVEGVEEGYCYLVDWRCFI